MKIILDFIVSFSVLFISFDILGKGNDFLSAAEELKAKEEKKLIKDSVYFSFFVLLGLMIIAQLFLKLLGVAIADFQIAAGIILFLMLVYFLTGKKESVLVFNDLKIFSRPVILLGGSTVLIMCVVLAKRHGFIAAALALAVNMYVMNYLLRRYAKIKKIVGRNSIKLLSYILHIFLAAFAVTLVKEGLMAITVFGK